MLENSDSYIFTPDLAASVRAAMALGRPLLLKGEPGTGKTRLAEELAAASRMRLLEWHVKSTTKAQQGLYEYDAVSRLRDSQLGEERARDVANYIIKGVLWEAFESDEQTVVLIDEIDKADIEFPNDLLHELDRMRFWVHETRKEVIARKRPIVIITSNNEKDLPEAFLRRCLFHYIRFPDEVTMEKIVRAHYPALEQDLVHAALKQFYETRAIPGLRKKPTTSELLDWLRLINSDGLPLDEVVNDDQLPTAASILIKNEQDLSLFKKLLAARAARPVAV